MKNNENDTTLENYDREKKCNNNNNRAAGRLKILILVNLEISLKKQTMSINYQPQHMSFCSREKQSYLKRSVQLRSSLQLLQVQPVV